MILTKVEFLSALRSEIRLILHLAAKIEPTQLDYRPSPSQRSTLDLVQYLTIMGPIHLRGVLAGTWTMESWRTAWQTGQATARTLALPAALDAIAQQPALFAELLGNSADDHLRAEIEMFGRRATRGALLVSLLLNHYAAYRMQLFLYLKASGHAELNTLNLWAGVDKFP